MTIVASDYLPRVQQCCKRIRWGNLNSSQLPAACLTIYALEKAANIINMLAQATHNANLCGCILLRVFFNVNSIYIPMYIAPRTMGK